MQQINFSVGGKLTLSGSQCILLCLGTVIQCVSTMVEIATNTLSQHYCSATDFQNLWLTRKLFSCSPSCTCFRSMQHPKDAPSLANSVPIVRQFAMKTMHNNFLRFGAHTHRRTTVNFAYNNNRRGTRKVSLFAKCPYTRSLIIIMYYR